MHPELNSHPPQWLNAASLLPDSEEQPTHDCAQVIDHLQDGWPDTWDHPLRKADATLYTNRSCYIEDGVRYAGALVVTLWGNLGPIFASKNICSKRRINSFDSGNKLGKRPSSNIYTNSQYAFASVHTHGALYQEYGLTNLCWKRN